MNERISNEKLRGKIMTADEAAALIPNGAQIGFGGFTGSGYPKDCLLYTSGCRPVPLSARNLQTC